MTTLPASAIVIVLFAALLNFIATQPPKKALDRHVLAIELYLEGKDKVLDADINIVKDVPPTCESKNKSKSKFILAISISWLKNRANILNIVCL